MVCLIFSGNLSLNLHLHHQDCHKRAVDATTDSVQELWLTIQHYLSILGRDLLQGCGISLVELLQILSKISLLRSTSTKIIVKLKIISLIYMYIFAYYHLCSNQ